MWSGGAAVSGEAMLGDVVGEGMTSGGLHRSSAPHRSTAQLRKEATVTCD
jgi:hypothetical protein